jgi:hypothetical protein
MTALALIGCFKAYADDGSISINHARMKESEFKGGIFRSDSPELLAITKVPLNGAFIIYLFRDGLVVRVYQSNVGEIFVIQMGVWTYGDGEISLYYAPGKNWSKPSEVLSLVSFGDDKKLFLTEKTVDVNKDSRLEILVHSFSYYEGIEKLDANKEVFLKSLVRGVIEPGGQ